MTQSRDFENPGAYAIPYQPQSTTMMQHGGMDESVMVIIAGVVILICAVAVVMIYNSRKKIANLAEDGLVKAIVPTVKAYRTVGKKGSALRERLKEKISSELEPKE